jgi:hypothetical protein
VRLGGLSIEKSNNIIGNRTRDLPACSIIFLFERNNAGLKICHDLSEQKSDSYAFLNAILSFKLCTLLSTAFFIFLPGLTVAGLAWVYCIVVKDLHILRKQFYTNTDVDNYIGYRRNILFEKKTVNFNFNTLTLIK